MYLKKFDLVVSLPRTKLTLACRNDSVIMACRNTAAADLAAKNIQQHPYKEGLKSTQTGKIMVEYLDLSSFKSVRAFARRFSGMGLPLNLLINNAGVPKT
jgi:retinol dehydrogenase-12